MYSVQYSQHDNYVSTAVTQTVVYDECSVGIGFIDILRRRPLRIIRAGRSAPQPSRPVARSTVGRQLLRFADVVAEAMALAAAVSQIGYMMPVGRAGQRRAQIYRQESICLQPAATVPIRHSLTITSIYGLHGAWGSGPSG